MAASAGGRHERGDDAPGGSRLHDVDDLCNVVDMEVIRGAHLKLGVDPLGGASNPYWERINAVHGTEIVVVTPASATRS